MDFINSVREKAKANIKKIVLPETEDDRILKAAYIITKEKIADIILVGNENTIKNKAKNIGINLDRMEIIDPQNCDVIDEFVESYTKKREKKGMTQEKARKILTEQYIFFGAMMVDKGMADGMVAGAVNSTGNTIRSIIHCVGPKDGVKTISSFFVIISPKTEFGENGLMFFADCGVVPDPNEAQLAEIAEATSENFKIFTGKDPKVAFLSFSTKGSASTPQTEKVVNAYNIFKEKNKDIKCDGEMQLDAALIPAICSKKAPGSPIAGRANILIFPDLNSGNIAYKLAQRFGDSEAIGPLLQGSKKPVNDLSRGCDVDDIVNVAAITSVEASGV